MAKVKEVSVQIRGVSYKPNDLHDELDDNSVILLRANNIEDDKVNLNDVVYVDKSRVSDSQYLQTGDILVCASSGSKNLVGKATIIKDDIIATFGAFCKVVRPKSILPQYLGHYFTSPKYRNTISELSAGANINNIRNEHIDSLDIPLPPLETQHQIAANLDKVTHTIDLCNAILEKLDLLVKSRFVEMFGDTESNPLNWVKAPMGNYMSLLTDFSSNGSYEYLDSNVIMYDEPNYALMVRTTDLEKNDFVTDVKYIDEKAYNILSKSKIYGNEIIMNKIGSAGKVYLMPVLNRPVSLGRNAFMFRFDEEINIVFLYHLLTSEYGTKEIQQHVRGAVTKTITKDAARSVRIIVPPLALQQQFAAFVEKTDKSKSAVKQVLEKAETLKKALMQEYFG
ncbi:restriction endonuclease subunit S [Ruminococcus sp.]|uniref:restriction endonuclease subunit S n=1 Tax=Ruminococcus sp. TaxID=41978 RepID=UPI0025882044|nr:restriction endonuclease subunit S [Ruminococcus sp.]MCR5020832.1 restriction endonuclease subunit S [Ruminococcus sp.]